MSDYKLQYWPVPFRGQFVRAILALAGKTWTETDHETTADLMGAPPAEMPVPFMGPPVLVDDSGGIAISQMPAILLYLGETLGLIPDAPSGRALTMKVVADANDVLDEMTLSGGRAMWTEESWAAFEPRLRRWMALWEETGRRNGLTGRSGFLLCGDAPGVVDVVTAILWTTMTDRLPPIGPIFEETAPLTAALCRRVSALPPLAELDRAARRDYGDAWCGGEIEASLRKVLGA